MGFCGWKSPEGETKKNLARPRSAMHWSAAAASGHARHGCALIAERPITGVASSDSGRIQFRSSNPTTHGRSTETWNSPTLRTAAPLPIGTRAGSLVAVPLRSFCLAAASAETIGNCLPPLDASDGKPIVLCLVSPPPPPRALISGGDLSHGGVGASKFVISETSPHPEGTAP